MAEGSDVAAVVLAAGLGTRFHSDRAKVLHRVAGRSLLRHVLEALRPLDLGQIVVVVGYQAEEVTAEAEAAKLDHLTTVRQDDQLGTGHAAAQTLPALHDDVRRVLIVPGDAPLLTPDALRRLVAAADGVTAALLRVELENPSGYGRILHDDAGRIVGIVEEADATAAERQLHEVNAGMYVIGRAALEASLGELDADNAQGEQYLTDVVGILARQGHEIRAVSAAAESVHGVNDRRQLAEAGRMLRARMLERLMADGVTVVDPATTYIEVDVEVGRETVLLPGCLLEGRTRIGQGAVIGPYSRLVDAEVDDGASVTYSVVVGAVIGAEATVGPFSHLRPGTRLERRAKAGGFVEMKQATVGEGSKVPHLSYIGDARIGQEVNIGAGTITCNYDGFEKHETEVGDGAFVGSDTMLVAPVRIGRGAVTGAGSVITEDVPDDALAVERSEQRVAEGWVTRRRQRRQRRA